ncbi:MAG: glycosyl transferase [Deltaproteobacteria bacterium RIFCSPLOWO2_12_FULL_40_28]|nr:MAG: glycosyl transferase [Deltaproteobacteria bacterium RIFCSPHIGHO2_02_FULL_40_28]OGQ20123.1 MAG: glycosyl transferase [Deltaproteobacteria bacterium RIFCSPHIGHO2_12_FULL_40_32]OGQ40694.1 MAG: glycosyl transferase [Deltaproteobacteria bacterium RIFCSPLOWO2_02_FULL_40_36]OGQ54390.1 MAG: glycosyl transferase [Deltaproteobacteria bacterium RIFCSPLOWO2_12_FULL_40_28]
MNSSKNLDLSVIIPFLNEEENLPELYEKLEKVLPQLGKSYEIIFIDDGSTDGGFEILKNISHQNPKVKLIRFTRNFGQTAAMAAGFREARGQVYVTLDADNQNDPNDIPKILEKLDEGYGVVSGWRKMRQDALITRKLPSWFANWLISKVTGVVLRDYGCTLKAYRSIYVDTFNLYGEMHRFIPAYAKLAGAKITEIPVNHFSRQKGKSKYGLSRIFKVMFDLVTVKFLGSFATKPLYLFGGAGMGLNVISVILGFFVLYQKFFHDVFAHRNPLLLLAVFLSVLGFLFVMMGLLAELLMRTYHESQGKTIYLVQERINF